MACTSRIRGEFSKNIARAGGNVCSGFAAVGIVDLAQR
jgi:hypothetical protein